MRIFAEFLPGILRKFCKLKSTNQDLLGLQTLYIICFKTSWDFYLELRYYYSNWWNFHQNFFATEIMRHSH